MTSHHRIGRLTGSSGRLAVELSLGVLSGLGSLKLLACWQPRSGLLVVVLVPLDMPGLVIRKMGRRLAGAFLLRPGEHFSMTVPPAAEECFRLETETVIRMSAEPGAVCGFCRTPLPAGSSMFALQSSENGMQGQVVCRACAAAWRASAVDQFQPRRRPEKRPV
jgi:hypothetical protein